MPQQIIEIYNDVRCIACYTEASIDDVEKVINTDVSEDGRSEWVWLRLADGTLALATFPTGNVYEEVSQLNDI